MIDVAAITRLQAATVVRWHRDEIDSPYQGFLGLVCRQHEQNFRLWHQDDIAQDSAAGDAQLAQVKRTMDRLHQERSVLTGAIDDHLAAEIRRRAVPRNPDARLNTETPGSVINRLSMLALHIYHAAEQAHREDTDDSHRERARRELALYWEQHRDLVAALRELVDDLERGRKRLKVYGRLKVIEASKFIPPVDQAAARPAA